MTKRDAVAKLDPAALRRLCDEYMRNNFIDPSISERLGVKRGLRNPDNTGVLAGLTNICDVVGYDRLENGTVRPREGTLIYRGIPVHRLIEEAYANDRFLFEEVIWLLLFGTLPSREELEQLGRIIEQRRELPEGFADDVIMREPSASIMSNMERSVLTLYSYDPNADDNSLDNMLNQSINLIAGLPTIMVYAMQVKRRVFEHQSMFFHMPVPGQSTAEHILSTYRPDQKFTHAEAKLLDTCLVLHADHGGGNNSTFACRVLSSTGTDTYSAVSAAIGSLKGPKHGGANLAAIHQLDMILSRVEKPEDDDELREFLRRILRRQEGDGSGLIHGMGHAVYTLSDPRAVILRDRARDLAYEKGFEREYELLRSIERLAPGVVKEEKGIENTCANVDLYSGLIYRILGISEDLFTPLFAIARIPGWCAHRVEQVMFSNRIIRPAYKYLGVKQKYLLLDER